MSHPQVNAVVAHALSRFDATVSLLSEYLAIPAISCEPEHADDVRELAARIRDDLEKLGLHECVVRELPGTLPIVTAEWMGAGEDAPTVLVYGHLDLQPVAGEVCTQVAGQPELNLRVRQNFHDGRKSRRRLLLKVTRQS